MSAATVSKDNGHEWRHTREDDHH